MAPHNRRSTSPVSVSDFKELQTEVQQLRLDISRHASVTRELRSIGLETQHLIRTRLRNNTATQTLSSPRMQPQSPTVLSTIRKTRVANKLTTEKIRNAATAITRPTQPKQDAVNRICWYHRQFGQTSSNCIQPCAFKAPVVTRQKVQQTPQFLVRVPLERVHPHNDHVVFDVNMEQPPSIETSPAPEPTANNSGADEQPGMAQQPEGSQPTGDWNSLQELYEQSFPNLSENSDSDSDSVMSQSDQKNM